jgi:hypothetical protein
MSSASMQQMASMVVMHRIAVAVVEYYLEEASFRHRHRYPMLDAQLAGAFVHNTMYVKSKQP